MSWVDAPFGVIIATIWLWQAPSSFGYRSGLTSHASYQEMGDSAMMRTIAMGPPLLQEKSGRFLGRGRRARPSPPNRFHVRIVYVIRVASCISHFALKCSVIHDRNNVYQSP